MPTKTAKTLALLLATYAGSTDAWPVNTKLVCRIKYDDLPPDTTPAYAVFDFGPTQPLVKLLCGINQDLMQFPNGAPLADTTACTSDRVQYCSINFREECKFPKGSPLHGNSWWRGVGESGMDACDEPKENRCATMKPC